MSKKNQISFDAIIFDIDGTLWDSREVVAIAWQAAVHDHTNLPADFDGESIGKHFGKPMKDIFRAIYPDLSDEELDNLTPYLYEYEHRYLRQMKPQPYEGVQKTLEVLAKKYDLYIVTNGQKGYTEAMLDATGLHAYFKGWLSYGDTFSSKDVTILKLMDKYDIRHTCYVGDTMGDLEASAKAGIPFIYCAYGLGEVDEAECEIENFDALPEAIRIMEQA